MATRQTAIRRTDVQTVRVALRVRRDRVVHKVRVATVLKALDDHKAKAAIARKVPADRRVKAVRAAGARPAAVATAVAIADFIRAKTQKKAA